MLTEHQNRVLRSWYQTHEWWNVRANDSILLSSGQEVTPELLDETSKRLSAKLAVAPAWESAWNSFCRATKSGFDTFANMLRCFELISGDEYIELYSNEPTVEAFWRVAWHPSQPLPLTERANAQLAEWNKKAALVKALGRPAADAVTVPLETLEAEMTTKYIKQGMSTTELRAFLHQSYLEKLQAVGGCDKFVPSHVRFPGTDYDEPMTRDTILALAKNDFKKFEYLVRTYTSAAVNKVLGVREPHSALGLTEVRDYDSLQKFLANVSQQHQQSKPAQKKYEGYPRLGTTMVPRGGVQAIPTKKWLKMLAKEDIHEFKNVCRVYGTQQVNDFLAAA